MLGHRFVIPGTSCADNQMNLTAGQEARGSPCSILMEFKIIFDKWSEGMVDNIIIAFVRLIIIKRMEKQVKIKEKTLI